MSDDFDDIDRDDLFTDPASLAAIERAVVTAEKKLAERNAKPRAQGQGQVGTAGIGGAARYHHTIAPSPNAHLRARGGESSSFVPSLSFPSPPSVLR